MWTSSPGDHLTSVQHHIAERSNSANAANTTPALKHRMHVECSVSSHA